MGQCRTVDILLATYNGEPFLAQQLDSLLSQTFTDWRLIIRDDGSTDGTLAIIKDYSLKLGSRITVLNSHGLNLGAKQNFSVLIEEATAPYLMFCDQDDVWLPNKIENCLAGIRLMEAEFGTEMAMMLYCDLEIVDRHLNTFAPSLWRYKQVDPRKESGLRNLLLRNVVTGCASIMNRTLADLIVPIPDEARLHDSWAAIVAAACGKLGYIDERLVRYRQHGANILGARTWSQLTAQFLAHPMKMLSYTKKFQESSQMQAKALYRRYLHEMNKEDQEMVHLFSGISKNRYIIRIYILLKYKILYRNIYRNLILLIII